MTLNPDAIPDTGLPSALAVAQNPINVHKQDITPGNALLIVPVISVPIPNGVDPEAAGTAMWDQYIKPLLTSLPEGVAFEVLGRRYVPGIDAALQIDFEMQAKLTIKQKNG